MRNVRFPKGVEVTGSAIIENRRGEILLVRDAKWRNKWVMPGGHVEPGETIIEAMAREGEEETELHLKPVALVTYGELIDSKDFDDPRHFVYFDVHCKAIGGKVRLHEALNSYRWMKPSDALKMDLGESYREVITEFIKYKKKAQGKRRIRSFV